MPNFWLLCLKFSYRISKNPSRGLIGMQKTIEIHLPHYEIPQPSLHYPSPLDFLNIIPIKWYGHFTYPSHFCPRSFEWPLNVDKVCRCTEYLLSVIIFFFLTHHSLGVFQKYMALREIYNPLLLKRTRLERLSILSCQKGCSNTE